MNRIEAFSEEQLIIYSLYVKINVKCFSWSIAILWSRAAGGQKIYTKNVPTTSTSSERSTVTILLFSSGISHCNN